MQTCKGPSAPVQSWQGSLRDVRDQASVEQAPMYGLTIGQKQGSSAGKEILSMSAELA